MSMFKKRYIILCCVLALFAVATIVVWMAIRAPVVDSPEGQIRTQLFYWEYHIRKGSAEWAEARLLQILRNASDLGVAVSADAHERAFVILGFKYFSEAKYRRAWDTLHENIGDCDVSPASLMYMAHLAGDAEGVDAVVGALSGPEAKAAGLVGAAMKAASKGDDDRVVAITAPSELDRAMALSERRKQWELWALFTRACSLDRLGLSEEACNALASHVMLYMDEYPPEGPIYRSLWLRVAEIGVRGGQQEGAVAIARIVEARLNVYTHDVSDDGYRSRIKKINEFKKGK